MKIRPDRWYRFECNAAREEFIEKLLDEHIVLNQITSEIHKAECLKYNSKTNAINYRTTYNAQYNIGYETYYVQGKEEDKMNDNFKIGPTVGTDPVVANYDPIVENYIKKEINKIQQEGQKQREKIIAGSTLGKIAKSYYEAMETIKPGCYHDSIESMVPFDFLNEEEQKKIHNINEKEYARRQELSELREVVMFKLSFCKTLREREGVYDEYGLD